MDTAQVVELTALIEKLHTEDLPVAAAKLFSKWCGVEGTSHEAIYEFFAAITEQQTGSARQQLDAMSATYAAASSPSPQRTFSS
jgi:hypothetical protein